MHDFTRSERQLIARLSTPRLVQRYLDGLSYNHEENGETLHGFRGVLRR
jgi:hypothetical protein